jgi:hypothetical protein
MQDACLIARMDAYRFASWHGRCTQYRPDGEPDPGVLHCDPENVDETLERFVEAIVKHRHYERETHPPRV